MDDVFVELKVVSHRHECVEHHAKFVLGGCNFVVMFFWLEAKFCHDGEHFRAHVLKAINWRDREVAALWSRPVAHVAAFVCAV